MTRKESKTTICNTADARSRLTSATQFLTALDTLDASEIPISNDVLATTAIHAAIAAADAICCARRQQHSSSGNHNDAAELLKTIDKQLGGELAKVLGYKNSAAYSTRETSPDQVKTCRRVAKSLVEAAQQAVQRATG